SISLYKVIRIDRMSLGYNRSSPAARPKVENSLLVKVYYLIFHLRKISRKLVRKWSYRILIRQTNFKSGIIYGTYISKRSSKIPHLGSDINRIKDIRSS